jgi:hypothetical protein
VLSLLKLLCLTASHAKLYKTIMVCTVADLPGTHLFPCLNFPCLPQVLGRNLEAVVNESMDIKAKFEDQFVSVEHLVLAMAGDARFGASLFKGEGITKAQLEAAIKDVSDAGWGGGAWGRGG